MARAKGKKRIPLRVVVKRAKVRDKPNGNGNMVKVLRFGARLYFEPLPENRTNDWIYVYEWFPLCDRRDPTFWGWIRLDAITDNKFEDYARLNFVNGSDEIAPVSIRYLGKAYDAIAPGEVVQVIVKVGNFCLTSKGWTDFNRLQKCRDIFDHESVITVFYHAMGQAYADYNNDLKRVVKGKFKDRDAIESTFRDIDQIDKWTKGSKYRPMFESLYDDYGIDRKWLAKKRNELLA